MINMSKEYKLKLSLSTILGLSLSVFVRAFIIMIAWGAIVSEMALSLPTLSYFQSLLIYWLVSNLVHPPFPLEWEIKEKK